MPKKVDFGAKQYLVCYFRMLWRFPISAASMSMLVANHYHKAVSITIRLLQLRYQVQANQTIQFMFGYCASLSQLVLFILWNFRKTFPRLFARNTSRSETNLKLKSISVAICTRAKKQVQARQPLKIVSTPNLNTTVEVTNSSFIRSMTIAKASQSRGVLRTILMQKEPYLSSTPLEIRHFMKIKSIFPDSSKNCFLLLSIASIDDANWLFLEFLLRLIKPLKLFWRSCTLYN